MARPLRIAYPGALYHVTARGNERRRIFLSQRDYEKFLSYLTDAIHKYDVILYAFTLMGNHYHLLVETPKANLSAFMHAVASAYTTYFNLKRKRAGHLFQGRYKSILVEKDPHLLELSRYVHLNPVRAGIVERPEDYAFSSYRSYIVPKAASIVARELIWDMVSGNRKEAPNRYKAFVESSLFKPSSNPFERVYGGIILGRAPFVRDALKRAAGTISKGETARRRVLASTVSSLDDLVAFLSGYFEMPEATIVSISPYRSYALYLARKHTPVTSAAIGRYFGITCAAVTKMGTRMKRRLENDKTLRDTIQGIEHTLSHVNG